MRFELLRQRVERAERRAEGCVDRAATERAALGEAWRRAWSPARIVVAGLLSGFLVGRSEPLSKVGGSRWLQMLGTVSSMLASLRAAAASEDAGDSADVAAQQASVAAEAASEGAVSGGPDPFGSAAAAPRDGIPGTATEAPVRAPAPAEAATEVSER